MTDDVQPSDPDPAGEVIFAVEGGVRVFWIVAPTMPDLVARLALVLGERMTDDDEMHITYNAMQNGWEDHPAQPRRLTKPPTPQWTELHFEYSACVVLRQRGAPPSA